MYHPVMYPIHFHVSPSHVTISFSFPWHIGTGVRCAITSDLSWYADISSARNCWLAIHRSEASTHTRDESSMVHANCMSSTSLRSFSCSDWILSFDVFVSFCHFHHKKKKTKKLKRKNLQKNLAWSRVLLFLCSLHCFYCLSFAFASVFVPSRTTKRRNPLKKS